MGPRAKCDVGFDIDDVVRPDAPKRRPVKSAVTLAFATLVFASLTPQIARAGGDFTDETCPNATAAGRHLNDLTATPTPMNDALMAAARALAVAYRACVASADRDQYNNRNGSPNGGAVNDGVDVGRLYARVALARSLRRVASYAGESGRTDEARASYASAHETLEQVAQIGGSLAPGGGGARHLVEEGRDLETQLDGEARAFGTPSPGASPR